MKIYISIPITGLNLMTQKGIAQEIAEKIRALGHEPVNPFNTPIAPPEMSEKEKSAYYMGEDIKRLLMCDAVYFHPQWTKSKGCSTGHGGNTDQFAREPVEGLAGTIKADHHNAVITKCRIRKLTPRECFRLMGVDDADIDNIDAYRIRTTLREGAVKEKPIPKSQKYKMAGNSIVVDVLYYIFHQMFIADPPKPKPVQQSLFD